MTMHGTHPGTDVTAWPATRRARRLGRRGSLDPNSQFPTLVPKDHVPSSERWVLVAAVGLFLLLATRQNAQVPATLGSSWSTLIMMATGGLWALTRPYDLRLARADDLAWVTALFFVGTSLLSTGWGWHIGLPFRADVSGPDVSSLRGLVLLLYFGFLLRHIVSVRALHLLVSAIVVGASVSAAFALIILLTGVDLAAVVRPPLTRMAGASIGDGLMRQGMLRPAGAAGHPLELAFVLSIAFPLTVTLVAMSRPGARRWFNIACCGLIGAGLLVSLSRSALVAAVAAVLVMAIFWPADRARRLLGTLGAGAVATLLLSPALISTIVTVFATSGKDDSVHSRARAIEYSIDMVARSPWLGCGDGCLAGRFHPYIDNQYLGRMLEGGVLGVTSFVIFLGAAAIAAARAAQLLRNPTSQADGAARDLAIGLVGAMVPILMITAVLDTAGFPQAWTLMWNVVALSWASSRLARRRHDELAAGGISPTPRPG